jgi:hypothetical protein
MRAKLNILSALVVGITAGIVAGCQTYDFEPVEPLALGQTTIISRVEARGTKPNLMLLVDTSGSMNTKSDPACSTNCPSRLQEMKQAMNSFLTGTGGSVARFGVTNYPSTALANGCGPAAGNEVKLDIPTALQDTDTAGFQAQATRVNQTIQALTASGGTPTGDSLRFVGALPSLQDVDRQDFVVLLTDGLPNCNPDNPNSFQANPVACECTLGTSCSSPGDLTYDKLGCLDKDGSVAAITQLQSTRQIRTIVIGFGAELTSGSAPATLNAMAQAGGAARACEQDADCGTGDTCNVAAKQCNRAFYQARNGAELAAALQKISEGLTTEPCLIKLESNQLPSDPSLLVVKITDDNQTRTATRAPSQSGPGDYVVTTRGVEFIGATCEAIKVSTPADPVTIEVYAVQAK